MTTAPHKVKIEIELDMIYTVLLSNSELASELFGLREELTKQIPDLTGQIYSVKFKNQKIKIDFID